MVLEAVFEGHAVLGGIEEADLGEGNMGHVGLSPLSCCFVLSRCYRQDLELEFQNA